MNKIIIAFLYVAVLIVMGAATLVESAKGTPFVHQYVYGAWWFTALWALLSAASVAYVVRSKSFWTKRNVSVVVLHVSFVVILAGALLTHLTGRGGTVHLRLGEPQGIAEIEHNGERYLHRLDFLMELDDFKVIEDEAGQAIDYRSDFTIRQFMPGDTTVEAFTVSMNNIATYGNLRFYQASYDYDRRGSTLIINRDPYGIPVTYCGYALLFLSFIAVCMKGSRSLGDMKTKWAVRLSALLLTALWCLYYFVLDGSWSQIPVLRHPLLVFHVVVIIMAYALLLIQTVASACWLLAKRQGASPSSLHLGGLRSALCLLSIGIFLGAIWANISWGNYWSWDSKEVWALVTLMIYAVPIHQRSLPVFGRPRWFHIYMLFAFLTVLMTYFGVNYLLTGLHSYN